jgi:hypothetical protein
MSATLRLVLTALIGIVFAGCLIPGPAWDHGDRGDQRSHYRDRDHDHDRDRGRDYDRDSGRR